MNPVYWGLKLISHFLTSIVNTPWRNFHKEEFDWWWRLFSNSSDVSHVANAMMSSISLSSVFLHQSRILCGSHNFIWSCLPVNLEGYKIFSGVVVQNFSMQVCLKMFFLLSRPTEHFITVFAWLCILVNFSEWHCEMTETNILVT